MSSVISAPELLELFRRPARIAIFDCRFTLTDPAQGQRDYETGHLPGAIYAHLEHDLSGSIVSGRSGRHPLPDPNDLAQKLGAWGVDRDTCVVAYDDGPGAFASRLWWLLRYLGHDDVRVLDGGIAAFEGAGGLLTTEVVRPSPRSFAPRPRREMVASLEEVAARSIDRGPLLFDSRSRDRFRGENETIDPRPGHIPGAVSLPFQENVVQGKLRPTSELAARFSEALRGANAEQAIVYCGSGVTACHNILSAEAAGYPGLRLYPGSYSEWIADGSRPVSRGDE